MRLEKECGEKIIKNLEEGWEEEEVFMEVVVLPRRLALNLALNPRAWRA